MTEAGLIKVLLVEDSPMDSKVLGVILSRASTAERSFAVTVAETLAEAGKRLSCESFGLVLLDLSLPDCSGLSTLHRMLEHAKDTPIIVLTGVDDENVGIQAVKAGAQDYIVKGQVSNKMLLRSIRYATERHSMLIQLESSRKKELELTEELFRHIYYNSPVMMYSFDRDGNISDVNNKWLEETGYSRNEVIGRRMDFLITEDMKLVSSSSVILEFLKTGAIKDFVCQYSRKDGGLIDVLLNCILTRMPSGEMTGISVVQNITDRVRGERELIRAKLELETRVSERTAELEKANRELQQEIRERMRFESALKQSKEYAELIYRVTPSAIFTVDREFNITSWNNRAAELTGYSSDEVIGRKCFILCRDKCNLDGFRCDGFVSQPREGVIITKSGKIRTILKNNALLKDSSGLTIGGIESFEDITERKLNEEQLRKLSYAIEQSPIATIITNLNGDIEYVNPRFTEMTGYQPEEVLGLNPRILKSGFTPAETYRQMWETIKKGGIWRGELINRNKTGDTYWELVSISPIKSGDGTITHFLAVVEDITSRKKIEMELLTARDLANNANKAKSEFLANISHEIRTPLNGIIGFTELLSATPLGEEQAEYLKTIKNSGIVLLNLINEILDFSKIEAGQIELEQVDFDIETVAYDICEMISFITLNKPIEILCTIDDALPSYVKGDAVRFKQVLTNLMSNAAKFTQRGEIELAINYSAGGDGGQIRVNGSVRDTGIGIPEEKMQTIFDAFKQADGSITRKYGGSGLGLTICRRLVNLMGGDISVHCPAEGGSVFCFDLVFGRSSQKQEIRETPSVLKNRRILVADDNRATLDLIQKILTLSDLTVECVPDASRALERIFGAAAAGKPFDMAILDIQMPDMDGYELARQIRTTDDPVIANTVLMAFSTLAFKDIKKFIESGFNGFVPKPVRRHKTIENIITALLRQAERQAADRDARRADGTELKKTDGSFQLRVLLAEDHPVNQKLAKILLTAEGYHVDVAPNGEDALNMFIRASAEAPYDIIFMDIQMPLLDGMSATKKIREFEEAQFKQRQQSQILHGGDTMSLNASWIEPRPVAVPIVAMTANAIKGDREKCIESGMNDYLPKPIKKEDIKEMINKWVLGESRPA